MLWIEDGQMSAVGVGVGVGTGSFAPPNPGAVRITTRDKTRSER